MGVAGALLLATALSAQTTLGTLPERVLAVEPVEPVRAELPQALLQKLKADLAERIGAAADGAQVVRAESVVWPDGGLGCGIPGETYTQGLLPGYRVELEWQRHTYVYHAAERGYFKLCGNPRPIGRRGD